MAPGKSGKPARMAGEPMYPVPTFFLFAFLTHGETGMFALSARAANDDVRFGMIAEGTSDHLRELRAIAGQGQVRHACKATLRGDPFDRRASVSVIVDGWPIGHLRATDAAGYVRRYGKYTRSCRAVILSAKADPWKLNVWLNLSL